MNPSRRNEGCLCPDRTRFQLSTCAQLGLFVFHLLQIFTRATATVGVTDLSPGGLCKLILNCVQQLLKDAVMQYMMSHIRKGMTYSLTYWDIAINWVKKKRKSTLAAEIRSIVKKKRLIWMNENNQILNLGEFTLIKASVRLLLK